MTFPVLLAASLVLTNLTDVSDAIHASHIGERFELDGTILISGKGSNTLFILARQGQCMTFRDVTPLRLSTRLATGNAIRASGVVAINENGIPAPNCDCIFVRDAAVAPPPPEVSARDFTSSRLDSQRIRVRGTVLRTFRDEIDPKYIHLTLTSDGAVFHATCCDDRTSGDDMRSLRGAEVMIDGVYSTSLSGLRELFGKSVNTLSPAAIRILRPAPTDPFSAPSIDTTNPTSPDEVSTIARLRATGRVIAVWRTRNLLLRDSAGKVRKVTLDGDDAPPCGETVEVVGTPETDLYRVNLSNAVWRPSAGQTPADEPPATMTAEELLTDGRGNYKINPTLHGRAVRLEGTVVNLPGNDPAYGIITLKSGDFAVPVDISANRGIADGLSIGCRISVAGTCVVETESWRPYSAMPRATGVTLVVRSPADVRTLSWPSWWTPQRFTLVAGMLLMAILAVVIWNRALQRMVDRKSRQLLKGEMAQIKSALRVNERTRLAVELHDSLSQNLSGVACQIAATKGTLPDGAEAAARQLETAERMLLSCRTELRRCLWDLRGDALEEKNFEEAIRKTIAPVATGAETHVRFDISRARLSDTTAHAVMCIIRELVSNAVRHGHAKTVRVTGEFHDGSLSFSVCDNGCGFDVAGVAGADEGHFGLEGIRERTKRLDGEFRITSTPGNGTKANINLKMKDEELR